MAVASLVVAPLFDFGGDNVLSHYLIAWSCFPLHNIAFGYPFYAQDSFSLAFVDALFPLTPFMRFVCQHPYVHPVRFHANMIYLSPFFGFRAPRIPLISQVAKLLSVSYIYILLPVLLLLGSGLDVYIWISTLFFPRHISLVPPVNYSAFDVQGILYIACISSIHLFLFSTFRVFSFQYGAMIYILSRWNLCTIPDRPSFDLYFHPAARNVFRYSALSASDCFPSEVFAGLSPIGVISQS